MKKYIDYETLRQILKERRIVRDTPDRRDEIEQLITLLDQLAFKSEARWRVTKAYPHWLYCSKCKVRMVPNVEMVEKYGIPVWCCPNCGAPMERGDLSYDLFSTETVELDRPEWIPVTPETMPPYTEYGASADLILRIREDGHDDVYTGYYQDGRWYTYMRGGTDVISEEIVVTHWMYADDLLKGAEENG